MDSKIELTGKKLSEHNSSFVEFEIANLDKEMSDEIRSEIENNDALWIGLPNRGGTFEKGSILIGFDWMDISCPDWFLLSENLTKESFEIVDEERKNH